MPDLTSFLPDDILAVVFHSLDPPDRKNSSLVCRRWLAVESQSRQRLTLDARASLADVIPQLISRFSAVSKLALKCDRKSDSIADQTLSLIADSFPNLTRLKLRSCRHVSHLGMEAVADRCRRLRKLSVGSCSFGAEGIAVLIRGCVLLEELSVKRLRGLNNSIVIEGSASLRSVCLKELYNGQCFGELLAGSPNLKTVKIYRCSGDWDRVVGEIGGRVKGITEVHLEKIQVTDAGLSKLASCVGLEILHLVKTPECSDAGIVAVAEKCLNLRKIHIDGWKTNRIGDDGLLAIAKGCRNLQELVLIGVNPTSRSLKLIGNNCGKLERLAFCSSETFGDVEIACIASKCVALKKLCIKGCPVSDKGMEALADGCPNLVKVKVKKCRGVTSDCVDWLMANREGMLAVNLDTVVANEQPEPSIGESGILENEQHMFMSSYQIGSMDFASSSNVRTMPWKTRVGFFTGRNFVASVFRRWSHGSSSSSPS